MTDGRFRQELYIKWSFSSVLSKTLKSIFFYQEAEVKKKIDSYALSILKKGALQAATCVIATNRLYMLHDERPCLPLFFLNCVQITLLYTACFGLLM